MAVEVVYVAAAVNRFNQAADVSATNLIAFGSSRLLAFWELDNPNDEGVKKTLPSGDSAVTAVKFLTDTLFISANESGMLNLWKKKADQWQNTLSIKAHLKSISTLSSLDDWIVTGSSDSSLKLWKLREGKEKDEISEVQTLNLKGRLPIISAISRLPQSAAYLLAVGGTDTKIQLWVCSDAQFVSAASLSGHEDWIRSLAFRQPTSEDSPLVLASGSQDATIRLWNIEPRKKIVTAKAGGTDDFVDELLDNFEASLGDLGESEEGGRQISLKHHIITVKTGSEISQQYAISFDALLVGHEAAVTSLSWRPDHHKMPTLLSTSTDSSLILWSPSSVTGVESASSVWINQQRFGDVGGQRLGGFVGGLWAKEGQEALAWGWTGGWRRWRSTATENLTSESWAEVGAISGHNGPVKGLDWSPDGNYIISSGLDQTTRIHGPARTKVNDHSSWHEISRPQVHGYDLFNVVFVDPLKFASIADEKVVRVFEAPRGFVELAGQLEVAQFSDEEHHRPIAANVPPLGLSNKAINDGPQELVGELDSSRRPFDGELATVTLWPEIEKIFGHGYESITLGISNNRKLIATACKATNAEHAVVRIYDTDKYKLVGDPLPGHVLTVTRIAFSPNDKLILTVSRDRSWRLFELQEGRGYLPVVADKSHGRIIWDCAWSFEGDIFATASRDKTVKVWRQHEGKWQAAATIKTPQPATAIAFTPAVESRRHLAVGLENGEILIYSNALSEVPKWMLAKTIPLGSCHVDHIHRMAWRLSRNNPYELASCSDDGTLRIITVHLAEN
ncbi:WD40 repeat-like protein [Crepidotus variabilis]|uniref:Elongator complex protein 2 n=1 Tax=Crepidotus variabilis TaxID=179855 RepID=A0A9P6ERP4_9AGAR|nr:WD40 repeat-like protein [Crepidotus variabilis]